MRLSGRIDRATDCNAKRCTLLSIGSGKVARNFALIPRAPPCGAPVGPPTPRGPPPSLRAAGPVVLWGICAPVALFSLERVTLCMSIVLSINA